METIVLKVSADWEKVPIPVFSISDFNKAVSLIKTIPFQINMSPSKTRKAINHAGRLAVVVVLMSVCFIINSLKGDQSYM